MDEEIFTIARDTEGAGALARHLFEEVRSRLAAALPEAARIHHIGATAVPGCLTKGDLDIVVRVEGRDFAKAEAAPVQALVDAVARHAELLGKRDFATFQNRVHLDLNPPAPKEAKAATKTEEGKP